MDEREKREEELRKALGKGEEEKEKEKGKKWYSTRRNWGFWLLVGGFLAYLITFYIIQPLFGG